MTVTMVEDPRVGVNRVILYGGKYMLTQRGVCIKAAIDNGEYAQVRWLPVFCEWWEQGWKYNEG